jgi:hypothetical protein
MQQHSTQTMSKSKWQEIQNDDARCEFAAGFCGALPDRRFRLFRHIL